MENILIILAISVVIGSAFVLPLVFGKKNKTEAPRYQPTEQKLH